MTELTYRKGPLGYSILKGDKAIGWIKKRTVGWVLKINGHTFHNDTVNQITQSKLSPVKTFDSLAEAKANATAILNAKEPT